MVNLLVEGTLDEEVLRRVLEDFSIRVGLVLLGGGKSFVDARLVDFCCTPSSVRRIALRDLDHDAKCAPRLRKNLLGVHRIAPPHLFRIPVRAVEAWLLADRSRFASFLGVQPRRLPQAPERAATPKSTVLRLARGSGKRSIREGLVAMERGELVEGPLYNTLMAEFVRSKWRPALAEKKSPSLARFRARI